MFRSICSDKSSRTWQHSPLFENGNLEQFDISSFVTYYSNEDDDDEWDINGDPIYRWEYV